MIGDKTLEARGIKEVAYAAGWKAVKLGSLDGWAYPMYSLEESPVLLPNHQPVRRWKCMTPKPKEKDKVWFKYTYIPKDSQDIYTQHYYYVLPGLRHAIGQDGGTLYLTSGEPDTLVFRAAGSENTANLYGEDHFPVTFKEDLLALGVQRLVTFHDLDAPGEKWADRIASYLSESGIEVFQYNLPAELGEHGDINKLWQKVSFDREKFWDILANLPEYTPKSLEAVQTGQDKREFTDADKERFQPYCDEIVRRLGVDLATEKASGFCRNVKCPFHADDSASAAWNVKSMLLKCFTCQRVYKAVEVADRLGVSKDLIIPEDRPERKPEVKEKTVVREKVDHQEKVLATIGLPPTGMPKPIPNPLRSMWRYEGAARSLPGGLLMSIVARSSGRKTGLLLTYLASCMMTGADVALYSPEWTEREIWRWIISQSNGPTFSDFMANDAWLVEEANEVPLADRVGRKFNVQQLSMLQSTVARIQTWPGKLHYIKPTIYSNELTAAGVRKIRRITTELVLDEIELKRKELADQGRQLRVLGIDYLQLLARDNTGSEADEVAMMMKAYTDEHRFVTIIPSQVTKELARSKDTLDMYSMLGARPNAFQFILTINPTDRVPTYKGWITADINIAKNSRGKRTDETPVPVQIHAASGMFTDELKQIKLNEEYDSHWAAKAADKMKMTEEPYED